ncbi:AraC family transcriptional regulator [Pontibacter sp. G13]|uniref:helix-turn-helix domain-containing protein n=1 Tax=Pontibacter sp. G13 TaxID=3074898 RepID=UPI002889FB2E|nr:AraC family transcriptional regulator [Pontibacter sp. G13]WNJ19638.1 AraC family transcriptional regulator [Pontibacter sp. G13]
MIRTLLARFICLSTTWRVPDTDLTQTDVSAYSVIPSLETFASPMLIDFGRGISLDPSTMMLLPISTLPWQSLTILLGVIMLSVIGLLLYKIYHLTDKTHHLEQALAERNQEIHESQQDLAIANLSIPAGPIAQQAAYSFDIPPREEMPQPMADLHPQSEFLDRMIEVIEENMGEESLKIELFTRELGVSRTILYERVKAITGESVSAFVKDYRLKFAAQLLKQGNFMTSEVAYQVGFNDPKYFSKCFKKKYGQTPREYIKGITAHAN